MRKSNIWILFILEFQLTYKHNLKLKNENNKTNYCGQLRSEQSQATVFSGILLEALKQDGVSYFTLHTVFALISISICMLRL